MRPVGADEAGRHPQLRGGDAAVDAFSPDSASIQARPAGLCSLAGRAVIRRCWPDDGFRPWDTLADRRVQPRRALPRQQLWPADAKAAAAIRAQRLRRDAPAEVSRRAAAIPAMNIEAKLPEMAGAKPGAGRTGRCPCARPDRASSRCGPRLPDCAITAISTAVRCCSANSALPTPTAPVVMRPATYAPPLPEAITAR